MYTSTILSGLLFSAVALTAPTAPSHKTSGSIDDVLPPIVPVNTRSGNEELITKLMTAPTQQERARLLNQPGDFVFDFNDSGAPRGGFSTSATSKTFPALIGNGAAMTLGFLGPCGMNTAHVHNRATELNVIVKGRLVTNFIIENGLAPIANTMNTFQMSVFPQGAIHQEFNPDCEDAVFVAGFNNVDPGVEQVAQAFFNLRPDVVSSTLGGVQTIDGADLESFRDHIPANIALGIDACLNKCGIKRNAKRDLNEIFSSNQN
ncbi:spherulin-1B precursor [Colletotrichum tofieldiae]|nr:spherulin-1B precursor [Colletotrichum tofieldiae]